VAGIEFDVAIFTNLTRDHLDYHQTFENYANAKAKLFKFPGLKFAILNLDDPSSKLMQQDMNKNAKAIWYSSEHITKADLYAEHITMQRQGMDISIAGRFGKAECHLPLLGQFNVSNVLAAMSALLVLGFDLASLVQMSAKLKPVKGRMELIIYPHAPVVVIDFAHTPDALEKALVAIKAHCHGKIWVLFGCGGNRDRGKRPEMAKKAERFADEIIVTQDNSRLEQPADIFADIIKGFAKKVPHIEEDRKKAIEYVLLQARPTDCILLAGKGHENYMDFQGHKTHFDEHEIVNEFLRNKV
jgi:UDP-N-acetylmuramoyl-L-alanyl-D-glutamate--2,6-diaminopimelate ligase